VTTQATDLSAPQQTWRLDTDNGSMRPRSALDVLVDLNDKVSTGEVGEYQPVPLGFTPLDKTIGTGLRAGELLLIGGAQGTGKTTIAKLIAAEIADEFNVCVYNATEFTLAVAREAVRGARTYGLGQKSGRAIIVNEAHELRNDVLVYLDDALEPIPQHLVWCFTTTKAGQQQLFDDHFDAGPVFSRCTKLALAQRDLAKPFAERAQRIARSAGLDGQPIGEYLKLAVKHKNNLRAMLGDIEAGGMLESEGGVE